MSFTYDLALTGDGLIVSQIRLEIGDTDFADGGGVKPPALANFTDAELLYFYGAENSNVLYAAARVCEVLARMWAKQSQSVKIRDYTVDTRQRAKDFRDLANDIRDRAALSFVGGSAPTVRSDGYSNDVNSQETGAGSGPEYWRKRPVMRW